MAQAEIKAIVKKRNHFEYALKRIGSEKEDYLRYIQYEMNLNILQKKRKKKLGTASLLLQLRFSFSCMLFPNSQSFLLSLRERFICLIFDDLISTILMHLYGASGIMRLPESVEHHFAKWITVIFGRLLNKFGSDVTLWLQYIEYLKKTRNAATLNRVFAQYGRTLLCFS
jgi:hypothetical protein